MLPTAFDLAHARGRHIATSAAALLAIAAALSGCYRVTALDGGAAGPPAAHAFTTGVPGFVYSPYKYLPVAIDPAFPAMSSAVLGKLSPPVGAGSLTALGIDTLTWAFATGECGAETWDGHRSPEGCQRQHCGLRARRCRLHHLDRRRGRHLYLRDRCRHGAIHRPLRFAAPDRHRLRHRGGTNRGSDPLARATRAQRPATSSPASLQLHAGHAGRERRQPRQPERPRASGC